MFEKPFSEAAERNAPPILEVLRREFEDSTHVLEIGSGTGQHAVHFAAALPHLIWQTSDRDENHPAINAWVSDADLGNIMAPLSLDVQQAEIEPQAYDAVYSANTAHIMSYAAVIDMFSKVGTALCPDGVFCLYGPFLLRGNFTSPSNAQFDAGLRARDPLMGIRDLDALDELAMSSGLQRSGLYALPANNMLAVWRKRQQPCQ
ncbi:MAG: DUF938 domain-containing protein [Woeseiaceae bacterium]